MLGWEYPPHISGGLGTACQGLTQALSKRDISITFVVPHLYGAESTPHMEIDAPNRESTTFEFDVATEQTSVATTKTHQVRMVKINSLLSPYIQVDEYQSKLEELQRSFAVNNLSITKLSLTEFSKAPTPIYGHDMFDEVRRYSEFVLEKFGRESFDVIHAHDWMAVPAAILLSEQTKVPFVLHIHSLESDRSGANPNYQIEALERLGTQRANTVVAVSHYTKRIIGQQFEVPEQKISVVHNGFYPDKVKNTYLEEDSSLDTTDRKKRVLFLGRVTMQKGPDYFVEAAAKIVPLIPNVEFIMAGSGDMLGRLKARVVALGIERNFVFPGFLKGKEVERAYALADVYVMPSVSEPFGIAALEAVKFDTPVILSKQSGVSEVLSHAFKVDFWDTDKLADCIISAILYPELRTDMAQMAQEEVKGLHWESAAISIQKIYGQLAA